MRKGSALTPASAPSGADQADPDQTGRRSSSEAIPAPALLSVSDLWVRYSAIQAVRGVSLEVHEREIVALLGVNGAGKTTVLNAIAGAVPIAGGTVRFGDRDITGWPPERVVQNGLAMSPEGRRIFHGLTVAENLRVAGGFISRRACEERANEILDLFPAVAGKLSERAGHLSGGQQQQLAIARALMRQPRLLLLDEPSLGLAPKIIDTVFDLIGELSRRGVTILIVEQNATRTLDLASRAYVLQSGQVVLHGVARDLDPVDIEAAYLGMPLTEAGEGGDRG